MYFRIFPYMKARAGGGVASGDVGVPVERDQRRRVNGFGRAGLAVQSPVGIVSREGRSYMSERGPRHYHPGPHRPGVSRAGAVVGVIVVLAVAVGVIAV